MSLSKGSNCVACVAVGKLPAIPLILPADVAAISGAGDVAVTNSGVAVAKSTAVAVCGISISVGVRVGNKSGSAVSVAIGTSADGVTVGVLTNGRTVGAFTSCVAASTVAMACARVAMVADCTGTSCCKACR